MLNVSALCIKVAHATLCFNDLKDGAHAISLFRFCVCEILVFIYFSIYMHMHIMNYYYEEILNCSYLPTLLCTIRIVFW